MATVPLHGYTGKYCNLENNFGMEISFGNEVLCETIDSFFDKMLENAPTPKRGSSWDQQVCENSESYMYNFKKSSGTSKNPYLSEVVQLNSIILLFLLSVHMLRTLKLNMKSQQGQTHCLPGRR